jgi:hypothetical protein
MAGQTVPVDASFSNGARWPADTILPPEERAGCNCELTITLEAPDAARPPAAESS